jgi:hypothetical protein
VRKFFWPLIHCSQLFLLLTLLGGPATAQTTYERTFSKSVSDAQRAVDDLRESSSPGISRSITTNADTTSARFT